jgi:ribonuclease HI
MDKKKYKSSKPKKPVYYAVKHGFKPGIYETWAECKKQTIGYPKAVYKKFDTIEDCKNYITGNYDKTDFTQTLQLSQEIISKIKSDSYNPDESYLMESWNKYENQYYLFTDGSEKKFDFKSTTRLGIYLGMDTINISQTIPNSTNNRCELLAIRYALEMILQNKKEIKSRQNIDEDDELYIGPIVIVSDSEYCINACSKWISNWQKNNWKTANSKDVANQDIFKPILLLLNKLKLHKVNYEFQHVNSHKSPPLSDKKGTFLWKGNQIADFLAQDKI